MSDNHFKIHKGVTLAPQSAEPANPTNGDAYYDSTLNRFRKYENGAWGNWGSGSGSGINYITNPDAEVDAAGWNLYNDGSSSTPTDGTGGSSGAAFIRTTILPLRGAASFSFAPQGLDRQGEGVSTDITVDRADEGEALVVAFDYSIANTYTNGAIRVFAYDITNAELLPISNDDDGDILNHSGLSGRFVGKFQTKSTSTSYRIIYHFALAGAASWTMRIDNVSVGPDILVPGAIITKPENFTPSFTNFTLGNGTVDQATWHREGSFMVGSIGVTYGSTSSMGDMRFDVPDNKTIDSNIQQLGSGSICGYGRVLEAGVGFNELGVHPVNTTTIRILALGAAGTYVNNAVLSTTVPINWDSGDKFNVHFKIPISGWSAGAIQSTTETLFSTPKTIAKAVLPTGTLGASWNKMTFGSLDKNDLTSYDTSTGIWTAPKAGVINCSAFTYVTYTSAVAKTTLVRFANTTTGKYVTGSTFNEGTATSVFSSCSGLLEVAKGDSVEIQSWTDGASAVFASSGISNPSDFSITYEPDFSSFSVFGETDLVESLSGFISYPLSAATHGDLTSIVLTPGEWDVIGLGTFIHDTAGTASRYELGILDTSGTDVTGQAFGDNYVLGYTSAVAASGNSTMMKTTITVTETKTYYLKAKYNNSVSNLKVSYKISARKVK